MDCTTTTRSTQHMIIMRHSNDDWQRTGEDWMLLLQYDCIW